MIFLLTIACTFLVLGTFDDDHEANETNDYCDEEQGKFNCFSGQKMHKNAIIQHFSKIFGTIVSYSVNQKSRPVHYINM